MKLNNKLAIQALFLLTVVMAFSACQKMDKPGLDNLIFDPPPPPYSPLKHWWSFEDNIGDSGQYRSKPTSKNISYVTGVTGKAVQIGTGGYFLVSNVNDSLKTLGSFTLSFWMNGVGPVQNGAQGLFSLSNKNQFWGNIDLFLENLNEGATAFLKVHMFNTNASDGKGEEWNEVKIPNALNKWTHIAITYNAANSQFSIYADGQPTAINQKVLGGGNYGALKFQDVNGMVVGTYQFQTSPSLTNHGPEDWAKSFNGALDQFRLYNIPLTAAQVTELYNSKQ